MHCTGVVIEYTFNLRHHLHKDEIAVSVGANPTFALELAQMLQNSHGAATSNAAPGMPSPSLALPASKTTGPPSEETTNTVQKDAPPDPPKKKPKAPKPQAGGKYEN